MPARAAHALPSVSPEEMEFLISRTGMSLNPGQMADLVLAWRQVSAIAATIPRRSAQRDDFASAFRLPPPAPRMAVKPKAKPAAKAAPPPPVKATLTKSATAPARSAKSPPEKAKSAKSASAKKSER